MTRDELKAEMHPFLVHAEDIVRRHAREYAPNVAPHMLDAICRALGDISIDEAIQGLDRLARADGVHGRE